MPPRYATICLYALKRSKTPYNGILYCAHIGIPATAKMALKRL